MRSMKFYLALVIPSLVLFIYNVSAQIVAFRGGYESPFSILNFKTAPYFNKTISVNFKYARLADVISELSSMTGIRFYYSSDIIPVDKIVSFQVDNAVVADVLDKVFTTFGVNWIPVSVDQVVLVIAEMQQQERGNIQGRVTDEAGNPVPFANILVVGTRFGAAANVRGEYLIENVMPGTYVLRASAIGYKTRTIEVTVRPGETATVNFALSFDILRMGEVVVTGTFTPLSKMESSVAISTLSPRELTISNPRSTTEMLRYIPGFTRVESSGGEVNQNISIRGILGVEYVMFMEDGMPVYPTMHTFFMNADNLFRPDENIERIEVIRGGNSALFGSNTPGAIINFINKTGGSELSGTVKATIGTQGLARIDLNVNGPLGDKWRFNLGGFYRYDRGVRYPGYPGIRGGQLKANVTRLLDNGYIRASLKIIDDRNQFILPLPFQNPSDPKYVPGFSDYGAMSTNEGNHIRVPIPSGELELPLDDGLRTKAYWLTADIGFDFAGGWSIQNTAQIMSNDQGWNAIVPFDVMTKDEYIASLNLPQNWTAKLFFTNHRDARGNKLEFNTSNNLVAPGGEWHVEKPISAFQNQFQIKKSFGEHNLSFGLYFGYYTQINRWYFTEILTDIRDNPRFLDVVIYTPTDTIEYTKNGFRRWLSFYVNGNGSTTIFSGVLGGQFKLTEKLRADLGFRYEMDEFVQTSENTSDKDLDGNPWTRYDLVHWGWSKSFRNFYRRMRDWSASFGLNYLLSDRVSIYAQANRGFKMPALDEFLFAQAQEQVELYEARNTVMVEGGIKFSSPVIAFMLNGFWGELRNQVGQGAETDPATGEIHWVLRTFPNNRTYGAEVEFSAKPISQLEILWAGTFTNAKTVEPGGAALTAGGIPSSLLNLAITYTVQNINLLADWHYVGKRDMIFGDYDPKIKKFRTYQKIGELKAYHYLNLGVFYTLPNQAVTLALNVLNVYQSKGFEEGNPRLPAAGGKNLFLARPILPRRITFSLQYKF